MDLNPNSGRLLDVAWVGGRFKLHLLDLQKKLWKTKKKMNLWMFTMKKKKSRNFGPPDPPPPEIAAWKSAGTLTLPTIRVKFFFRTCIKFTRWWLKNSKNYWYILFNKSSTISTHAFFQKTISHGKSGLEVQNILTFP